MNNNNFGWMPFYGQMARALAAYADKKDALFGKIKGLAEKNPLLHYLHFEKTQFWQEREDIIDPFTIMAIFNRATTAEHRRELAELVARLLGVTETAPTVFHGVAHLDPRNSIFAGGKLLWQLFALALAGRRDGEFSKVFTASANAHGNGLAMLSIGLFWVNPQKYMPLDKISIPFIEASFGLTPPQDKGDAGEYLDFLAKLDDKLGKQSDAYAQLALDAWRQAQGS